MGWNMNVRRDSGRKATQEGGGEKGRVKSRALRSCLFTAAVLRLCFSSFSPALTLLLFL